MVFVELSAIFGQSLGPVLVLIAAVSVIWMTAQAFFKYLIRAIRHGRDRANEDFDREFHL